MTRAMCSRSSKRKQAKSGQELIPDDCKENIPVVAKQQTNKKTPQVKGLNVSSTKVNISSGSNSLKQENKFTNCESLLPSRKSDRQRKSPFTNKDFIYNIPNTRSDRYIQEKRNVLCDKTNSSVTKEIRTNTANFISPKTFNIENNDKLKAAVPSALSEKCDDKNKVTNKRHVPIYKSVSSDASVFSSALPPQKKEAVYEFDEVDENEPVQKRKRKKKTYVKKPRMGPKALTINNIKYSSTESLVSLPDKPVKQKRSKRVASNLKSYSSATNLNTIEDSCYSIKSFMSHPPLLQSHENKDLKSKTELSVLHETQSEELQSSINNNSRDFVIPGHSDRSELRSSRRLSCNSAISIPSECPNSSPKVCSQSYQDSSVNLHKRCYPPKKSCSNSVNFHTSDQNNFINQASYSSPNISRNSAFDFLSSTPCKRSSLIVYRNSVFDESDDKDIPLGLRPSTGFIKDSSEDNVTVDKYFGFDEPEELEEPLVSPIKNINLKEAKKPVRQLLQNVSDSKNSSSVKPSIQEVINLLKSTLPKTRKEEPSLVYSSSSSSSPVPSDPTSPISISMESSFKKPPRRSYERQRRIKHHSEDEEESEEENHEEKKNEGVKENTQMEPVKKCYQKPNTSRALKVPKISKAKQKVAKEEEELERLAAQMNAQFQEIEKVNLLVE